MAPGTEISQLMRGTGVPTTKIFAAPNRGCNSSLQKEPQDSSPAFVPPVQSKIDLVASELAVASEMFAAEEDG